MCELIACKKGTDKNSEFLFEAIRTASIKNNDGIGFAFKRNKQKKIFITKGFKSVDFVINLIKKKDLKVDDELIIHLRIGNKGAKSIDMCHPFVISNDSETILSNDAFIDNGVMAHNGTFYDFSENGTFSDTYAFVKDFMSLPEIQTLLKRDTELFVKTFKFFLRTNKLAFIFPDTSLITIGDFIEDQGYLFSNISYKRSDYENVGGVEKYKYGFQNYLHYDDYDYDDYVDIRPNVPNKNDTGSQSKILFGSNHENKLNANQTKIIEKLIADGKATKIGTRTRDDNGFLLADSKLDLIPPAGRDDLVAIFNKSMKVWLRPCPGLVMYVPLKYMSSQFDRSFINPCVFNYDHFTFYSPIVGDDAFSINPRVIYKIHDYDENADPNGSKQPTHGLTSEKYDEGSYKGLVDVLWMNNHEMIENLTQTVRSEYRNAYLGVYRLCKRFSNPSKNLRIQLEKAISGAEKKNKKTDINFKNESGLTILALKIYANYIIQECYEWEVAKKMFYKVQNKDKSVSFDAALSAFNKGELVN